MIVTVNLAKGALAMSRTQGHRQASQRHPELRRHGRAVHGQDRHADAGPDHSQAPPRYRGERFGRVLEYAYLNSFYQSGLKNLLDVAVLQACGAEGGLKVQSQIPEDRRDAVRLRAAAHVGRSRSAMTATHMLDLQGRGRRGVRGLQALRDRRRDRPARRKPFRRRPRDDGRTQRGRLPRGRGRLQGDAADAATIRSPTRPTSPCSATSRFSIRRRRPAPRRIARTQGQRRAGQNPHRRQRHRDAQNLPRSRPGGGPHRSRQRDREAVAGRIWRDLAETAAVFAKLSPSQKARRSSMPCTARATCRLSGRRHQRRPGAQGRRCRHLGGQRRRHRQGIRPTSSCWRRAWSCSARA